MTDFQLITICWGEKYGAPELNALISAVRRHAPGCKRVVLLSDRARPGLVDGVETRMMPEAFLRPEMKTGGCQAKLCMFERGLVPDDLPAVFLDLDTVVMGDIGRVFEAVDRPEQVAILQSAVLPFSALGRWLWRVSKGRRYARGNSSVVVFHPGHCPPIAARFQEVLAQYPDYSFKPLKADERFISWSAQPVMRKVPGRLAVKFPTEYMYPWLWFGRLYGALPWVRARRAGLVAITLPGFEVKAEALLAMPEGQIVTDRKGRKMEWSDRYLGPTRQRLMAHLRAGLGL